VCRAEPDESFTVGLADPESGLSHLYWRFRAGLHFLAYSYVFYDPFFPTLAASAVPLLNQVEGDTLHIYL